MEVICSINEDILKKNLSLDARAAKQTRDEGISSPNRVSRLLAAEPVTAPRVHVSVASVLLRHTGFVGLCLGFLGFGSSLDMVGNCVQIGGEPICRMGNDRV